MKSFLLLLVFLFTMLLFRGSAILSGGRTNVGLALLNRTMAAESPRTSVLATAEDVLASGAAAEEVYPRQRRALGLVLAAGGREEEAAMIWLGVGQMATELMSWGDRARNAGQYEEARIWYERASRLSPDNPSLLYYRGLMEQRLEHLAHARSLYEQGLQFLPDSKIGKSDFYGRLGELALQSKPPDFPEATSIFRRALAISDFGDPGGESSVHYHLGEALLALGQPKEAKKEFEWIVARQPTHYWSWMQLGKLAWDVDGNLEKAERNLHQAMSIDPDSKWAYRIMGRVYQDAGRLEEAAAMYQKTLQLDPKDPIATMGLNELGMGVGGRD